MKPLFFTYVLAFAAMATADDYELEKLLQEGNSKFTARMFSEVSKANEGDSFILSAYSVLTPLAQLALASVDESHDELLDAIGMPNDNTTKKVFSLVDKKLRSIKGITLKTASKIYVADKYKLNEQFAADTRNTFNSEVQNIDFRAKTEAAKEVNTWVEDQTDNRIKDLVDPDILGEDTKALLVNAIYFKGTWKNQFEKLHTRDREFYVDKAKTNTVPMMAIKGTYKYTERSKYKSQIIEIPYAGNESSFVIVLPNQIDGIDEVKEIFKEPTVLEEALQNLWEVEIELFMPKFKIETTTNLMDILTKMNVTKIFNENTAKLNNLLKGADGLYVSSATQKAFIEVNEEGAEAAAANVFALRLTSVHSKPLVIKFEANHPFLFFLRGKDHTLFSGIYYS